jgi:hypothetical protein
MRKVLAAASAHEIAYAGRPTIESQTDLTGPTDWRFFLDLLEQRGGSQAVAGLFEKWIVADDQRPTLAAHEAARAAYAALVAEVPGWLPGLAIRAELARWHFDAATAQIGEAGQVLDLRGRIATLESALGVADGGALQAAYEGAANSYDDSLTMAGDELATLQGLRAADAAARSQRGVLADIGLWGEDPAASLAAADAAYRSGNRDFARRRAAFVVALIAGADGAGTQRVAVVATGMGLVLVSGVGMVLLRRRRRNPEASALAAVPAEAPATLAARTAGPDAAPEPTPASGEGEEQA